ncbi:MAG: HD domain-containing protein [Planctomycetota bacterium]|nr:HD domain-containing protein [Planctomycetota bacterium]
MAMTTKLVRDTVHGYIKIPSSYFVDFIDKAIFQRLRNIEQTSIRVLYPSAHHDRFIHSLGTFHLAQTVFLSLKEREQFGTDIVLNDESLQHSFQIAALLHDYAHSPFSHIGEEFTKGLHKNSNETELLELASDSDFESDFKNSINTPAAHEVASALIALRSFKDTISSGYGGNPLLVARMITGCKFRNPNNRQQVENCLIELLNGPTIDVDKLDYILRDTWASGVKNASVDIGRLISALVFKKDQDDSLCVALSKRALSVIQNMVQARDFLYQWIVCHHKVVYDKHLLESAINDLGEALLKEVGSGTADDALRPLFSVESLIEPREIGKNFTTYLPSDGDIRFLLKHFCPDSNAAKQLLERRHSHPPAWKTFSEFTHHFRKELEPPGEEGKWKRNVETFLTRTKKKVEEEDWGTFCRVAPRLSMPKLGDMRIMISEDTVLCTYDDIFGRSDPPVCPYCYIFLREDIDTKDAIHELKDIARETAQKLLPQSPAPDLK